MRTVVGRPLSEHDLVERAKRGDVAAYTQLVRMHEQIAFRTAHLITGNHADAQDAAQEAFIKAYGALWRFRFGAPFRPWLLRIVANESHNQRRSASRRVGLVRRDGDDRTSGDAAPSPEAAALASERRAAVLAALEGLAEPHRMVIACRYFLELSEAETAAALGCRRGTVKSRLSRALKQLGLEMGEPGD
ncbi:MAG: RNA polymerase sigma factor [Solirubrobacterales bacterium]|nr:RNA polymerase sigma factor [Solirubrobacterales bacterium]